MNKKIVGLWQISNLTMPCQFAAFADAYLDSAARLCKALKRSTRKTSYPRGAVVLFLVHHAVELFLKAAILQKSPNENLYNNHNINHLEKLYCSLYPGKKYDFDVPFSKTVDLGLEPPEIPKQKTSKSVLNQAYRYPIDNKGNEWHTIFSFDPVSFLPVIDRLQADFNRLQSEIFSANTLLRRR